MTGKNSFQIIIVNADAKAKVIINFNQPQNADKSSIKTRNYRYTVKKALKALVELLSSSVLINISQLIILLVSVL